jgi:septation ring formation regulator EzrA
LECAARERRYGARRAAALSIRTPAERSFDTLMAPDYSSSVRERNGWGARGMDDNDESIRVEARLSRIERSLESLTGTMEVISQAQAQTQDTMGTLATWMARLAESQAHTPDLLAEHIKHTDEKFTDLASALAEHIKHTDEKFAEHIKHTDEKFAELASALAEHTKHTDETLAELAERFNIFISMFERHVSDDGRHLPPPDEKPPECPE